MLDINFIRENIEAIKEAAKNKNINLDFEHLLRLDDKRKGLQITLDDFRAKRNTHAKTTQNGKPTLDQIEIGKKLKEDIASEQKKMDVIMLEYMELMVKVPVITSSDTPVGKSELENVEVERKGEPRVFDFEPKDHIALGKDLDIIDFERGVKVAGYRGYYMKNEGASLQMAIMMYAIEKLVQKGFVLMIPPTLVKEFALFGSGYFSGKVFNENTDEIYKIANKEIEADGNENRENKFLIGTAEPSLLAYYADEVLDEKDLPIKLCGFSQCYRSEIGSYGKDTKGLYRVHEFMKVEQVCLCPADKEMANKLHQEMLGIAKEFHEAIGLPYRVLQICTGDMSAGKYKMFDMEAWIPSRNSYGETGSASNFLDWQSRRLNVRYKNKEGVKQNVYMLNNTAIASPRFIISILENFQNKDGSVTIPQVLQKYMPGNKGIIEKK
ncbi:serine--tRNA ligase [Patescibacteria group bacterium]|nr:serine--tRNA ligase [Patescibacteria group bacterium]MBU1729964.1 serine--tRNA ligase [Patescibacteria group bacterium]MBU1956433.1 serine--tRNA ligase [Patescibacteria group bacterium]